MPTTKNNSFTPVKAFNNKFNPKLTAIAKNKLTEFPKATQFQPFKANNLMFKEEKVQTKTANRMQEAVLTIV